MKSLRCVLAATVKGGPRLPRPTNYGLAGTKRSRRRRAPPRTTFSAAQERPARGHDLLNGRYPTNPGPPIAVNHPDNLFARLGATYRITAYESVTSLCPDSLCVERSPEETDSLASLISDVRIVSLHLLLPQAFTGALPPVDTTWAGFQYAGDRDAAADDEREFEGVRTRAQNAIKNDRQRALDGFMAESAGTDRRTPFYYAHLMLPHVPYEFIHTGHRYEPARLPGTSDDIWEDDEWLMAQAQQRHLLQLGMTDRQLGELLDEAEAAGLDDAMVIVTADHGVSFRPGHPRRDLIQEAIGDIAAVPLFIRYPDQRCGVIDDRPVGLAEVAPTVLDVIGGVSEDLDGVSLRRDGKLRAERVAFTDEGQLTVPLDGDEKNAIVAKKVDLFGDREGSDAVYNYGSQSDLIGQAAPRAADWL